MTSRSRTLLLLGVTALAGTLSGCIIESSGSSCPDLPEQRYFAVQWEIDNGTGTPMLLCSETPPSHVELTTSTSSTPLVVGQQQCSTTSGVLYNWSGVTQSGLPTGTVVVTARLISDSDGRVLSTADVPPSAQIPIRACQGVAHTFEFPL
jgi:hypothetical protein